MIKAEYIDHMGDDLMVTNAARVSMGKHHTFFDKSDEKLLKYLATHNHWTPFSHPQITLRESVPIFVSRQRFKHMVGFTYNEISRRYVDTPPSFFIPDEWRSRPDGSIKQGSGGKHIHSNDWMLNYHQLLDSVEHTYNQMIADGVAPEQARMVLPQSMVTEYYVTGSLAAWARAFKLRIDDHAQVEIQVLADQWGQIIEPMFPVSWKALT